MNQEQQSTNKKGLKFWVDIAVSIGASVVIVGALFKILHWPYATELLITGMLTESAIFLIYAYLGWKHPETGDHGKGGGTSKLDSTELINALKEVKGSIETTNASLSAISEQTDGFKNLKPKFETLEKTLDELNDNFGGIKNLSDSLKSSELDANRTKEQLKALANNLEELNGVYRNMINAIKGQ